MARSLPLSIFILSIAAVAPSVARGVAPKHRLLTADSSRGRIAIIDEQGNTEWESQIGPLHDLHYLDNGHVLYQTSWTQLLEVDPQTGKTIWEYDSGRANGNQGKRVEVHAFQRLENGNTMIAESGVSRIIEVNHAGELVHEMPLQVDDPHPHRDTRLVRKLQSGNYLVCHEGMGMVREYAPDGTILWDYEVPLFGKRPAGGHGPEAYGNQCFAAVRMDNGNTLISTGNGHGIIEVTPMKEIVWRLKQNDLEGITLAWITTLQILPNDNIVLGNCHAGERNPQVVEINRAKEVVWQFRDFDRFGNALTNTQILSTDGGPIHALPGKQR